MLRDALLSVIRIAQGVGDAAHLERSELLERWSGLLGYRPAVNVLLKHLRALKLSGLVLAPGRSTYRVPDDPGTVRYSARQLPHRARQVLDRARCAPPPLGTPMQPSEFSPTYQQKGRSDEVAPASFARAPRDSSTQGDGSSSTDWRPSSSASYPPLWDVPSMQGSCCTRLTFERPRNLRNSDIPNAARAPSELARAVDGTARAVGRPVRVGCQLRNAGANAIGSPPSEVNSAPAASDGDEQQRQQDVLNALDELEIGKARALSESGPETDPGHPHTLAEVRAAVRLAKNDRRRSPDEDVRGLIVHKLESGEARRFLRRQASCPREGRPAPIPVVRAFVTPGPEITAGVIDQVGPELAKLLPAVCRIYVSGGRVVIVFPTGYAAEWFNQHEKAVTIAVRRHLNTDAPLAIDTAVEPAAFQESRP